MPNTVATIAAIPQEIVTASAAGQWKRQGQRKDGKPCCMKAYMMQKGSPDQVKVRLEFGGGAVTYGHPLLKSALTEHYQGHRAMLRLSGRSEVKYRFYDDQAKQEIWLHEDPGTNVFEEQMWLEGLSLVNSGGHWTFNDARGVPVGSIPPLVVRAINVEKGTLLSTIATMDVAPRADGSYLVRITVDAVWLAERFAAGDVVVIDPTTVATSTSSTATAVGNQRKVARFSNGVLVAIYNNGDNTCRYSTDNGQTWNIPPAGELPGGNGPASLFIDADAYIHYVYSFTDSVYYKRGTPDANRTSYTWSAALTLDSSGFAVYPTVVAHAEGTGWKAHVAWSYLNGTVNYAKYQRIDITSGSAISLDGTTLNLGGSYGIASHTYPSIAIDGSKHLYVTWTTGGTGTGLGNRFKKASYSSGAWTWGSEEAVTEGFTGFNGQGPCLVDSTGRCVLAWSNAGTNVALVWRRAAAGGWSDISPSSLAAGRVTLAIDDLDNLYLFYNDAGLFYRKYSSLWSDAVTVDADTTSVHPSTRVDIGGSAIDVVYTHGSASPYNVKHHRLSLNQAPNAPTLTTEPNFDATTAQTLAWTFSDPDAGNTQSAYQLLIVRVSDSVTVVDTGKVASTISTHALAASTLTNPNQYQWQVRTWDNSDRVGPYSSLGTFYTSAKPSATITVPATDGATVTGSSLTTEWSFSDPESEGQSAYQVRLTDNADVALWTSGKLASVSARARTIGYTLVNSTSYKVKVTVWDAKDVASTEVVRTFTVSFTPTVTPTITVTPNADQFPPYAAVTVDNKQVDVTTEGNVLTLSGGATTLGTDTVLDAQNEQGAVQHATLGTGKYRFTLTVKDTAQVVNDVTMEVYNVTDAAVVISTTKTVTAAFAAYTLDFDATQGKTYELRVRKATATANTITADKAQVSPVTATSSNNIQRSTDNGATWTTMTTGLAVNGMYKDYTPASGTIYQYRAVANGNSGTSSTSAAKTGGIDRTHWWFVPKDTPANAIPFAWNRESSWQHDRAFTEVETRGPATVHFFGGKKLDRFDISAMFVDATDATPHDAVTLTKEQWRQRFIDLVGVQGYLCSADGLVERGILMPPSGTFGRDMIVNAWTVQVIFVEKGPVP